MGTIRLIRCFCGGMPKVHPFGGKPRWFVGCSLETCLEETRIYDEPSMAAYEWNSARRFDTDEIQKAPRSRAGAVSACK